MAWAAGVIVIIGVGLPLGAWLLTRRTARRPPGELSTGDPNTDWLRREYGLAWLERSRVQTAVAEGKRVSDSALEGAAHELAARTLSGNLPRLRQLNFVGRMNLGIGVALTGIGVADLVRHPSRSGSYFLIPEGILLAVNGWFIFVWQPKRQRRAAARALDLNHAGPGSASPGTATAGTAAERTATERTTTERTAMEGTAMEGTATEGTPMEGSATIDRATAGRPSVGDP